MLERLADDPDQLGALERLGQEVDGAILHRLDGFLDGAERRQQDHVHVGSTADEQRVVRDEHVRSAHDLFDAGAIPTRNRRELDPDDRRQQLLRDRSADRTRADEPDANRVALPPASLERGIEDDHVPMPA